MGASWLGYANRRVVCFGRALPRGAGKAPKAAGKVFAPRYRIQRKLLSFVHTLFTAWFSLKRHSHNWLMFQGLPRRHLGFDHHSVM